MDRFAEMRSLATRWSSNVTMQDLLGRMIDELQALNGADAAIAAVTRDAIVRSDHPDGYAATSSRDPDYLLARIATNHRKIRELRQRAETAERERDEARARADEGIEMAHSGTRNAIAERDAAREALRKYGWHLPECGANDPPPHYPCTCGFTAALESKEA